MNFSTNSPASPRLRKVWCCIGFCFGIGVTRLGGTPYLIDFGDSGLQVEQAPKSEPYLCRVGAPALRFREPPALPLPEEPKPASAKATETAHPSPKQSQPETTASVPAAKPHPAEVTEAHSTPPPSPDTGEPSIIQDEVRPRVRTEEFLPFFQLPSAPPDSIPPSTATYQQK